MASMELKATNFLSQKDSNYINFFLYGEEPSLTFRCLKHVLLNEDMKMIEKIYLNLDDENFESNFTQSIMTNSLFNEKKIIFINLEKNRLNKDILKEINCGQLFLPRNEKPSFKDDADLSKFDLIFQRGKNGCGNLAINNQ